MTGKRKQILGFAAGSAVLVGLDQWTKYLAVTHLKGQGSLAMIPGVFELLYSENRGAAFSILQGKQGFLFAITAAVLLLVVYGLVKMPANRRFLPLTICLTMLFSGAVGNLIDRVAQGYVVDFLYFSLIDFPIFNVADIYVTVSAAFFIILLLWVYQEEELSVFSLSGKSGEGKERES